MTFSSSDFTVEAKGSILGGSLLIAGSCIGAGMLALPIQSGLAGFFPSLIMFLIAWSYMTLTGLLLVEINGWVAKEANFISMAGYTLGRIAKIISWIIYLFLFYSLLVAYISGSGSLLTLFFPFPLPYTVGSLLFVIIFGTIVYLGTRVVDHCNRILMFFKVTAFGLILFFGLRYIHSDLLLRTEPKYMLSSLPILIVSFGFHNMVPSLMSYLGGNVKRVRKTVLIGSTLVLMIYLFWQVLILGIIPMKGTHGLWDSFQQGKEASQSLSLTLQNSLVGILARFLGFFALLTSFLAQTLSMVHFLTDGLKLELKKRNAIGMCGLALIPPTALALYDPSIFFKALNFAGGICAVILFGILPSLMAWKGRYVLKFIYPYQLKGGKLLLVVLILFSLFVLIYQIQTFI